MSVATFPDITSYGCIETEHRAVELIARDVEAMAELLLGRDTKLTAGAAITTDQALVANTAYPIGSLTGNVTLTAPAAGMANNKIVLLRTGTTAHTVDVASLYTMPASTAGVVILRSNGTAWVLDHATIASKVVYETGTSATFAGAADGFTLSSGTVPRELSLTAGDLSCTAPTAGAALTLTDDLLRVGAHSLTLRTSGTTALTVPTTGIPATLAGTERMISKVVGHTGAVLSFTGGGGLTETIQIAQGNVRWIDATTGASTLTLGTTDAVAGDWIAIARANTGAHTVAVVNGGAGAGTLMTMSVSKAAGCVVVFDGTNWRLAASYQA